MTQIYLQEGIGSVKQADVGIADYLKRVSRDNLGSRGNLGVVKIKRNYIKVQFSLFFKPAPYLCSIIRE